MDLQDKKALITGGTSGMGSAAALAIAEKGASVIITGRDETRGASTVEEIRAGGHDAQFIAADFSAMSEVRRVADAAGEIDVLVNCAALPPGRHHSRQRSDTKPLGRRLLLARNPGNVAGLRAGGGDRSPHRRRRAARRHTSEHELLRDTAAIHEPAEAGDLRGRVVLVPEG